MGLSVEKFQGFFSYAHADANLDTSIIEAFSVELEKRVAAKIVNAEFSIWRDRERLSTGDVWRDEIAEAVEKSDVMILMLSPSWINSDMCRQEYKIFEDKESSITSGFYVVPILIRETDGQKQHLRPDQLQILASIEERQYNKVLSGEFTQLSPGEKTKTLERVADDVVGMIDRLRKVGRESCLPRRVFKQKSSTKKEFSVQARNFEEIDFVDQPEIEVRRSADGALILGQFDFVDRLYVQGDRARIEFGIRRADLIIKDADGSEILRSEHIRASSSVKYLTLRDDPAALVVSMDPPSGRNTLGELPLPPGPASGENRLSEIGSLPAESNANIDAKLSVSLNVEGLVLFDGPNAGNVGRARQAVEKIAAIAVAKHTGGAEGKAIRLVRVKKR